MIKGVCKTVTVIAGLVSLVGLISFVGGIRAVNAGAFIFPALIAVGAYMAFIKK